MKKLIISLGVLVALLIPAVAGASSYWTQYNAVYGAGGTYWQVYQYPTGSYWVTYNNIYGQGGLYCTLYGWNC